MFLVAATIPSVMLIRGALGKRGLVALVLGGVFSCVVYIVAFYAGMAPFC